MRTVLIPIVAFALSGCMVGPDWQKPETDAPESWLIQPVTERDLRAEIHWWTQFNDPQLDRLVALGIEQNLDIQVAATRVLESRAQLRAQGGELYPQLDASGSYTRQRASEESPLPISELAEQGLAELTQEFWRVGAQASWQIDLFGRIRRAVEAAAARVELSEAQMRGVVLTTLADTVDAYVRYQGLHRQKKTAERLVEIREQSAARVATRVRAGLAPKLELRRAEGALASARAIVPNIEAAISEQAFTLGFLLASEPGTLALEASTATELPEQLIVGSPAQMLARRPDVASAEADYRAALAEQGRAEALRYPEIFISGAFAWEAEDTIDLFGMSARTWQILPSVRIPLFTAGRIAANIDAASAAARGAELRFQLQLLRALREAETAFAILQAERRTIERLQTAVAESEEAARLATVLYDRGLRDFLTVTDAEDELARTSLELAEAETRSLVAAVQVYRALGGGWQPFDDKVTLTDTP